MLRNVVTGRLDRVTVDRLTGVRRCGTPAERGWLRDARRGLDGAGVLLVVRARGGAGEPPRAPQTGHAPIPWVASTRFATWICSSREAPDGLPEPPLALQVDWVNCSPPAKPLPVLVLQLP